MSHENEEKRIPKLSLRFWQSIVSAIAQISEAFEEKGDVLEITGFPIKVFCFRDPDHCQQILTHKVTGGTKLPALLPRIKWAMGARSSYILPGGKAWKTKRMQIQSGFTPQDLVRYASITPQLVQNMFDRWKLLQYDKGRTIDLYAEMRRLVCDYFFQGFFSEDAGDILDELQERTHHVSRGFAKPIPTWLPDPGTLSFKSDAAFIRQTMLRLVKKRRQSGELKNDLLSHFFSCKDEAAAVWSDEDIAGEMLVIFYGVSVMATAFTWVFYLLAMHPQVREKLYLESAKVLEEGRVPTVEDIEKIPYAQMVLNEALRLYPASWGYPRYAPEGMTVGGHLIPAKSLVIPMVYHVHRHPAFWQDPAAFNPERFSPEKHSKMHPFAFMPFSGGPRACLGTNLAPKILKTILVMMTLNYRFEHRPRFTGDPIVEFEFEIAPKGGMPIAIFPMKQPASVPSAEEARHA